MKSTYLSIAFITYGTLLCTADEPQDLTSLRERYLNAANLAVTPITKVYIKELNSLRANYQRRNDEEKGAFIVAEIQRIEQLDGKGLVQLEPIEEEPVSASSPLGEQMIGLKGIWQDKANSHYEFKLPGMMVHTYRYISSGGMTETINEYKVTMGDQKLMIETVATGHSQYKTWYEVKLPLSRDELKLERLNVRPGSKTSSTVLLTKSRAIPSASVWHGDSVGAICDGISSKKSSDYSIPRQTWFPVKGSNEWVQLAFPNPRKVSESSVYWFDDVSVGGGCRVPESALILYKSGDEWKPVEANRKLGVAKDRWNKMSFEEVETTALRLKVQMHEEYSAGILEWKFE